MLHAMLSRAPGERMVVVLDSEYVCKGITIWSDKWRRHGWKTSSGEVGHRDLGLVGAHPVAARGSKRPLQLRWVPPHLNVDEFACQGREQHPNKLLPLSKHWRVTE